jgi:hypothetical protein
MDPDNAARAPVVYTGPRSRAVATAAMEPAASLQTPHSDKSMHIITPHRSLYISNTPALTVSSLPPSSPDLPCPDPQAKQSGPPDASCNTDEETDTEVFNEDASIHPRRVTADPKTLMAAEVLMRLCGRDNANKPPGTPAFKVLGPAFSTTTNTPLRITSSRTLNPPLVRPTLVVPSLVTTQRLDNPLFIASASINCLPLDSRFADPYPKTLPIRHMNAQPLEMLQAPTNVKTTAHTVIDEAAVVAIAPLVPIGTLQSTSQVTKASTEEVEGPAVALKPQPRKRKRGLPPAADLQPTPETKRSISGVPQAKRRNVSSSTKKSTTKFKDLTSKTSRSAKGPGLSLKSNAAPEGLIGHLITVLSLDGRSSLPFSKIVEQVLESQPHLLDERPTAEWSELVKKTLNYSSNTMFGRAERKGLKVHS